MTIVTAFFAFHSRWHVDAPYECVWDVLNDYETYPSWWQEVRSVERVEDAYSTVCRSLLPYELHFDMLEGAVVEGVIEGRLRGDLEGYSRWTLYPAREGVDLEYHQEVLLKRRLLDMLSPVAAPAFRANHALMMRHGRSGLATYMAGYLRGRAAET